MELVTRGNLEHAAVEGVLLPCTTDEAARTFARISRVRGPWRPSVTLLGAQRSFESHFLPATDAASPLAISSRKLKGPIAVLGRTITGGLRVRALAGTTFGELLAYVHRHVGGYMPFTCPTAESISLGGALAANTHGRTTDTYGGFFADRVPWFRLVAADGSTYECSAVASSSLERELYRYVPGALGALGLVTELELELCSILPGDTVLMQPSRQQHGDPMTTVLDYARATARDLPAVANTWSEGVGALFFGGPGTGRSLLLSSRRCSEACALRTMPLFGRSSTGNALLQAFAHRFTPQAQWLACQLLEHERRYRSSYYRWAFFQTSYDDAAELSRNGSGIWSALCRSLGVDAGLTLVHQAWVVPRDAVVDFMGCYFALLDSAPYRELGKHLEFQDLLPVPRSRWPMNPSFGHERGSHILTISCQVAGSQPALLSMAKAFCRELSRLGHELGAKVQLIKQLHVDDELLREMYVEELAALRALKARVDPHGMLRTRTLQRLGVC